MSTLLVDDLLDTVDLISMIVTKMFQHCLGSLRSRALTLVGSLQSRVSSPSC